MAYTIGLQSAQLKNFDITIDGVKLTLGQVVSLKMKWSMNNFKVVGSILFKDLSNMVKQLPIRGGNEILMTMTDFDEVASKQKFIISNVSTTRSKTGEPVTILSFTDPITSKAMKMFNGMSWLEATALDIIDHPETIGPFLVDKGKDFCPPPSKLINFVMPLHTSFNVVMHWLAKNANKFLFQTRENFVFQPIDVLFSRGVKGDIYRYKTPNEHYRRRILQHDAKFGKVTETDMFQPKAKIAHFDVSYKHKQWIEEDYVSAQGKLGSTGNTPQVIEGTIGTKQFYKSHTTIADSGPGMYTKNSYKANELHILVPGQFATNVGDIIELDLVNYESPETPDDNINGTWIITEIVDNIIPPDFVQRLSLSRAKFAK